jgi:glutathione synthase/RimK-type ligase-like ATP-grasp enzyme
MTHESKWSVRHSSGSHRTAKELLLINFGRQHEDTQKLAEILKADHGFRVKIINLFQKDFSKINFKDVAAVDLKDCRGWQGNMDFFDSQMRILQQKIKATGRQIPIINPPEIFNWVASKEYLKDFENSGIPIVPTTFLHRGEALPNINAMMERNPDKRIVLKPARGARNSDILFITKKSENEYELTSPQPSAEAPAPHVMTVTRPALENYLKGYQEKLFIQQHQPVILIQEYFNANEISTVFIGSDPHYIERSRDQNNLVAHEDFGGSNRLQPHPDSQVVELAQKVKDALPEHLRNIPYLRVDVLRKDHHPPLLLEVEAGSSRLFLLEADRVQDYASMVNGKVQEAETINRQNTGSITP